MMKKYFILLILGTFLFSCKSKSRIVTRKSSSKKTNTYTTKKPVKVNGTYSEPVKNNTNTTVSTSKKADNVVSKALTFKGTRYKYGGNSKSGMDCSGLVFTSFKSVNINLPRTSISQSTIGQNIKTEDIEKGDLVFFKTSSKNKINHVGIVISKTGTDIKFIHSSTSRGVMISSLREGYWSQAYVKAQRVLTDYETISSSEPVTNNPNTKTHTVKKGDTLYSIARKHHTSVNAIMKKNNLSSTSLQLGMRLNIPD